MDDNGAVTQGDEVSQLKQSLEDIKRENGLLAEKLDRLNSYRKQLSEAEREVHSARNAVESLREQQKSAKERLDEALSNLCYVVRQNPDQKTLPFPEVTEGVAATCDQDLAGATPLSKIGITESVLEKLSRFDVQTVAQLEAFAASGKLVPKSIKGLGETAINKVTDKLLAFRQEHPRPEQSQPLKDGRYLPVHYSEGEIACADGKQFKDCPYPADTLMSLSWLAGFNRADAKAESAEDNPVWEEACEALTHVVTLCQQVLDGGDDAGADFAKSVLDSAQSMRATIQEHERVTSAQVQAIENWKNGLAPWVE